MGNYHTKYDIGDTVYKHGYNNHVCNCDNCTCSPETKIVQSVTIGSITIRAGGGVYYYATAPGVSGDFYERELYGTEFEAASKLNESETE